MGFEICDSPRNFFAVSYLEEIEMLKNVKYFE